MIAGNIGMFALYLIGSGPASLTLQRTLTVTPDSGVHSVFTFHALHTSPVPLLVNCGLLATLGAYHCSTYGRASFLRLFGVGCGAASLAVLLSARNDVNQTYAGHLGASAALLSYHAFKSTSAFRLIPWWCRSPVGLVGLAMMYGLVYDDRAVLAGISAGYLAFLAAL